MNSFYSQYAGCTVRWQDLPGSGEPVVFIHGLAAPLLMNIPVLSVMHGLVRAGPFLSTSW